MRVLMRGDHFLGRLAWVLLLVVAAVSLGEAITGHRDARMARHSARADRAALLQVTAALRTQCAQQIDQQTRLRAIESTDVDLQRGLITADQHNRLITPDVRAGRRKVYQRKLDVDLTFLRLPAPTPAVCEPFSRPLPAAFHTDALPGATP